MLGLSYVLYSKATRYIKEGIKVILAGAGAKAGSDFHDQGKEWAKESLDNFKEQLKDSTGKSAPSA